MQQLTALVFVLSVVPALVNAQTVSEIIARYNSSSTTYQGLTIPYRYYVPKNYSPSNKYAIITFLHGAGERGIDNVKQLVRTPIILANDTVQSLYKFFIVAPQCPSNLDWHKNATLRAAVKQAQDDLITKFPAIDGANLRFITGLSAGSFGTWTSVNQFPGVYNKAVPMAGGYGGINKANFRKTRIWTFHSSNDPAVQYSTTSNVVTLLRNDGQTVLFDDPRAEHIIDEIVLRQYPVIDWLFNDTGTGLTRSTLTQTPTSTPTSNPTSSPTAKISTSESNEQNSVASCAVVVQAWLLAWVSLCIVM